MKLTKRIATLSVAATAALICNVGSAQAQDSGELLSLLDNSPIPLLNNSSLIQTCYPMGQVGQGNTSGTQTSTCSQTADTTASGGNGAGGVTGAEIVRGQGRTLAPGESGGDLAVCPEGKTATGGGFTTSQPGFQDQATGPLSPPPGPGQLDRPDSWSVDGVNEGSQPLLVRALAVCVDDATA